MNSSPTPTWLDTPDVQSALASIIASPPAAEVRASTFNRTLGRYYERDPRVVALRRAHRRFSKGLDPDTPEGRHWLDVGVDQAIDAAIAGRSSTPAKKAA